MYLTYLEYKSMGGTLDETTFNDYEFQASAQVDWYTFNRFQKDTTYPEKLKKCMFHLIKLIQLQMDALTVGQTAGSDSSGASGGIASQSNDGVSISYNTLSAKDAVDLAGPEIKKTINQSLQGVMNSLGQKVLYRGLYPNE